MKRQRISFLEISIFGSSIIMMGLIFWFLSLTYLGSSGNSEAELLVSLKPSNAPGNALDRISASSIVEAAQTLTAPEESRHLSSLSEPASAKFQDQNDPYKNNIKAALGEAPQLAESSKNNKASSAERTAKENAVQMETASMPKKEKNDSSPPEGLEKTKMPASRVIAFEPSVLRDPMLKPEELAVWIRRRKPQPQQQEEGGSSSLEKVKRKISVQGILNTPDGVVAIINNVIVKRGEVIAGAKLIQIMGNQIKFKYKEHIFVKKVSTD